MWFVCMGFMALITVRVLCATAPGLKTLYCQCQCLGYMLYRRLLDLKVEESRVIRNVKPPRCGKASTTPRALSWDRPQGISARVHARMICMALIAIVLYGLTRHVSRFIFITVSGPVESYIR